MHATVPTAMLRKTARQVTETFSRGRAHREGGRGQGQSSQNHVKPSHNQTERERPARPRRHRRPLPTYKFLLLFQAKNVAVTVQLNNEPA